MNASPGSERGIQYWMLRVVKEADKARNGFEADPVHDLRVAIRRCRSMAEGFRAVDPDPAWNKMRKAGKAVFSALGELRDVQVLMEWTQKLGAANDPVRARLNDYCSAREATLKLQAANALSAFDTAQWLGWAETLQGRAAQIPSEGGVFQVIALEKWTAARSLHSRALRNRSRVAYHSLRIGLKHFRYIVENFLPELHQHWGEDLKDIQDLLGEVHDLDVLLETARTAHTFAAPQERLRWRARILKERNTRIAAYHGKMAGRNSLWQQWRAGLPEGEELRSAVLEKFRIWAGFLDPDPAHTNHVLATALRLYDALADLRSGPGRDLSMRDLSMRDLSFNDVPERDLLTVAVRAHEVGRTRKGKHHKRARRMIEELDVPPDWSAMHLRIVGLVARYHTGALPRGQAPYAALPQPARKVVDRLAGVLRLADALDAGHDQNIREIEVQRTDGVLRIRAEGYLPRTRGAEQIAAAGHLLETTCGFPIMIEAKQAETNSVETKPSVSRTAPPALQRRSTAVRKTRA